MKQLTGIDASFLYMETASQFGHVSSMAVYERPFWRERLPHVALPRHVAGCLVVEQAPGRAGEGALPVRCMRSGTLSPSAPG